MSDLSTRPEILKLARVLGVDPERFAYLENVDPEDLKQLRGQVTDTLFDANLAVLQRMALASRLLPVPLLAKIGEKVFGPLLCARLAGVIDASRGVDVAKRLSTGYLADVAVELDPRRASAIISGIPLEAVAEVAAELTRREDWITIGRFVGHLADRTVVACLEVMPDPALLQVAYVLDDKSRLDHVIGLLPAARVSRLLRTTADRALVDDLLAHLSPARRAQLTTE